MEFLVRIEIARPADADGATVQALIAREAAHAATLIAAGHLLRLWRVVGRWANISIWSARDGTHLHELLTALPLYDWMRITIEPLAVHPSDPGASDAT